MPKKPLQTRKAEPRLKPSKETQDFAMYIAMAVRNAMEDFHCKHLSDEQMKELNPIIRDAICSALFAFENYGKHPGATAYLNSTCDMIPGYWEAPQLTSDLLESFSYIEQRFGMESPEQPKTRMPLINRQVAVIRLKEPFLSWVNSIPDAGTPLSLSDLDQERSVLLIPDFDFTDDARAYVESIYKQIFERELFSWYENKALWPKRRMLKMFRDWFEIEIHSVVVDTLDDEIVKTDFDL